MLPQPFLIFPIVGRFDFPGKVSPGRYFSASLLLLGATSSFCGYTSSELANFSVVFQGLFILNHLGFSSQLCASPSSS